MADPTLLPLGPTLGLSEENAKAARNFVLAVLAARLLPAPVRGPVLRYGLGLELAAETGAITAGPLALSNLLPAPFGFAPASNFGLKPNFYLPPGSGDALPGILPGVKEQRAEDAAAKRAEEEAAAREKARRQPIILENFGDEALGRIRDVALSPAGIERFADPASVAAAIDAELVQRQRQYAASNAIIEARQAALAGGAAVADVFGSNLTPDLGVPGNNGGATGEVVEALAGAVIHSAFTAVVPAQAGPPAGFVEIPHTFGAPLQVPQTKKDYRDRVNPITGSSFIDPLMAYLAGDP